MASPRTACHWFVSVVRDPAGQHNLPRVIVSIEGSRSSVASVEALMFQMTIVVTRPGEAILPWAEAQFVSMSGKDMFEFHRQEVE